MKMLVLALLWPAHALANADDIVTRPLVLEQGQVAARLSLEVGLDLRYTGSPTSLAPDAWYGVTDRFTVGVTHSNASLDRIAAGASFCVTRRDLVCEHAYRGGVVEARYGWLTGAFSVAPRARILVRDVDPVKPAVAIGALLRWTHGRFAIESDPYLRTGLANTDRGNRTFLMLPLYVGFQPTCRWYLGLHLGYEADVAVWRDGWHGPVGVRAMARVTEQIDVEFHGGFQSLVGSQNSPKQRAAMLSVSWRS